MDLLSKLDWFGGLVVGFVALAWLAAGRADPVLGPGALFADALVRPDARWRLAVLSLALCAVAAFVWLVATARPRAGTRARTDVRVVAVPVGSTALFVATLLRLTRHAQLRLNGIAAVVVPLALGVSMSIALGVEGTPIVGFAAGLALTAAALYPAAAQGLGRDTPWLLGAAPRRASWCALAISWAGVCAAGAVVATASTALVPLARADVETYVQLEAATAFVLGCAAFAGALVPWRPDHVVQQLASYGTLVTVAIVAWALSARLEPLARGAGLEEAFFGVVVGNGALALGVFGSAVFAR